MYDLYFSNFGRPTVPDDLCKDSAPRHPWSGEEKLYVKNSVDAYPNMPIRVRVRTDG